MSSQDLRHDTASVAPPDTASVASPDIEPADVPDRTAVEPADPGDRPAGGGSRGPWRRLRLISLWALGVVVALALVATGLVVWTVRRGFPEYDGTVSLPGLAAPVTIYRDAYGVPQVYARTAADLFSAQGYVHAQDRFWEMDFRRHVTAGRLAEMFGASMVPTDAFLRALGMRRVAEREWQLISSTARSHLRAYATGVNAWIADHGGAEATGRKSLEYTIVGLQNSGYRVEQWDPVDSLAWLKAMAWDLRGNMSAEIERTALLAHGLSRDQIDQIFPAYPFDRHRPIISGGAVADGAFDASAGGAAAPAAPAAAPRPGPDANAGDRVWRDSAPVLSALGAAVRSVSPLGVNGPGVGSNSWVVSGARTASGKPLLANDPHLGPTLPGIWYQVGLHCECGYNAAGFSMSGVPGVIIGHNDRVAWGLTNLGPDVTDLYLEKVEGDRYFDGTAWRGLSLREEIIEVAGDAPVSVTVRATGHGPLLSDRSPDLLGVAVRSPMDPSGAPLERVVPAPEPSLDPGAPGVPAQATSAPYAVALRWTALDPGRTIEAVFALNTADNWTDFRAAAALFDVPAQNMIYADVDGNIGYQAPGRVPVRGKGNGMWPAPGWDPAFDWKSYIPFAELPHVFNPPEGVIVTANQAVVGPQYPNLITRDWSYGYRSQRILDMIAERSARGKLSMEDMRQMQFDNHNGFAATLVPALLAVPLDADNEAGTVAAARDLLRDWDFQEPAESPGRTAAAAAFYNASLRHLLLRTFDELPANSLPSGDDGSWEILRSLLVTPSASWWDVGTTTNTESMNDILALAMSDAVAELTERLGADPAAWRWGDLHTLTLRSDSFGQSGIAPIEWFFNRGPFKAAGGGGIVNATNWSAGAGYEVDFVPSMRMIIDMSNFDESRWVQLTGNSGHAFHVNYTDQVELWRTGQNTAMHWDQSSIEAVAAHTLTLEPPIAE